MAYKAKTVGVQDIHVINDVILTMRWRWKVEKCQTFDIQNSVIRKTITFSELSAKLELSYTGTMPYLRCIALKLMLAGTLPAVPYEYIKSYLKSQSST